MFAHLSSPEQSRLTSASVTDSAWHLPTAPAGNGTDSTGFTESTNGHSPPTANGTGGRGSSPDNHLTLSSPVSNFPSPTPRFACPRSSPIDSATFSGRTCRRGSRAGPRPGSRTSSSPTRTAGGDQRLSGHNHAEVDAVDRPAEREAALAFLLETAGRDRQRGRAEGEAHDLGEGSMPSLLSASENAPRC